MSLSSFGAILDAAPRAESDGIYVLATRGFGDGSLYRVDLEARQVESVALAHAIGERDRLAASPDGTALMVAHYGAGIVEVLVGLQVVGELTLPAGISGAAIFTAANSTRRRFRSRSRRRRRSRPPRRSTNRRGYRPLHRGRSDSNHRPGRVVRRLLGRAIRQRLGRAAVEQHRRGGPRGARRRPRRRQ